MRPVPGITLATFMAAALTSAGFRQPSPGAKTTPDPSAAHTAVVQLSVSATEVELGGDDVIQARRAIDGSTTELLDSRGSVVATLVQSATAPRATVRGSDASALTPRPGADSRVVTFEPDDYSLVWKSESGGISAIVLSGTSSLEVKTSGVAVSSQAPPVVTEPSTHREFALLANRPNPFRDLTTIAFVLPKEGHVEVGLFDLAGRRVAQIFDDVRRAGPGSIEYRPHGIAAGRYEMRMTFVPSDGSAMRRSARPLLLLP